MECSGKQLKKNLAATFTGLSSLWNIVQDIELVLRHAVICSALRADLHFKTYNPAEEISKRWFRDYNFANAVLQIGINYPF